MCHQLEAEWTPLFQCCIYFGVIMRALISRIDRLTVTTGAKLKRLINMTLFRHMPICNDAGEGWLCGGVALDYPPRGEWFYGRHAFQFLCSTQLSPCSSCILTSPLLFFLLHLAPNVFASLSSSACKIPSPSDCHHILVSWSADSSSFKEEPCCPN